MAWEETPVGAISLKTMSSESTDEQQQQSASSPVDVIVRIREGLAEYQRAGGKQAFRAALREAFWRSFEEPGV
jgi:hypothetical protein